MQPSARHTLALRLLAALFACLAVAQHAAARQQVPPAQPTLRPEESDEVVRVSTELVQTDVTVIDRDGNFVDGLRADQFELKVDGKARPVLFFERVSAGSRDETAQLAAARGARASGGASAAGAVPLDRGRTIIVFVDDVHMSAVSLLQTRRTLLRFVEEELRQNDQMLVAAATGQVGFLQQLTDELPVLRAAVLRLGPRQVTTRDPERPPMSVVHAIAIEQNSQRVVDAFVDLTVAEGAAGDPRMASTRVIAEQHVRRRARTLVESATHVAGRTLDSLRGLVQASAQFPGRKVLYFISDGFAVETRRGTMLDRMRRVADAALRAGVVIYAVDARGLSAQFADTQTAASDGPVDPTGRLSGAGLSESAATQEPLRVLAGETGGRAILNTNSLGEAIGRTLKETSVYYLLAWRPEAEDARGERFRRVEVAVRDRPDLTVLAQRGFYSSAPEAGAAGGGDGRRDAKGGAAPAREAGRDLAAAFRAPLPRTGVPTTLTLNYAKHPDGRLVLNASVQIEVRATQPAPGAPPPTDRVELLVVFFDADGKPVANFTPQVSITPRAGANTPSTHSPVVNLQAFVKPGLYQVRAAGRDPKNGRTGSDVQWIEVPNISRGNFALSSIFLGSRPPSAAPTAAAADDGPQMLLATDRRFRRDDKLRFIVDLYNATVGGAGQPDAAIQLQVFRDDQPVVTSPLKMVSTEGLTEFSRLPYAAELSLADLPAGRYSLQLTAIDRLAKVSAKQRVKFTIE